MAGVQSIAHASRHTACTTLALPCAGLGGPHINELVHLGRHIVLILLHAARVNNGYNVVDGEAGLCDVR